MGRRNGPGGYQTRSSGALVYVYPVAGPAAFQPSGDPHRDPPEVDRPAYPSKTWAEQQEWDQLLISAGAGDLVRESKGDYWDRIRFYKTKSPRSLKRMMEREKKRMQKTQTQ